MPLSYKLTELADITGIHRTILHKLTKLNVLPIYTRHRDYILYDEAAIKIAKKIVKNFVKNPSVKNKYKLTARDMHYMGYDYFKNEDKDRYVRWKYREREFYSIKFTRITPRTIKCYAAYMGLNSSRMSIRNLYSMTGLSSGTMVRFMEQFHPIPYRPGQLCIQMGMYYVFKLCYKAGALPYGLARAIGILDNKGEGVESKDLRRINGIQTPTLHRDTSENGQTKDPLDDPIPIKGDPYGFGVKPKPNGKEDRSQSR